MRRRPNSKDKWIIQAFGDQPFKQLDIPDFNHLMNSVDRADHICSYYCLNRRNYRRWKPLWDYLFQTTICNAALIWMDQRHSTKREGGHLKFRAKLASQLMTYSTSSTHAIPVDGPGIRTKLQSHVITGTVGCGGVRMVLDGDSKECKVCMAQSRTAQANTKRMALQDLSASSVNTSENREKPRRPRPPEPDTAVLYAGSTFAKAVLAGKSISSNQEFRIEGLYSRARTVLQDSTTRGYKVVCMHIHSRR
jgi:hypothetical protein